MRRLLPVIALWSSIGLGCQTTSSVPDKIQTIRYTFVQYGAAQHQVEPIAGHYNFPELATNSLVYAKPTPPRMRDFQGSESDLMHTLFRQVKHIEYSDGLVRFLDQPESIPSGLEWKFVGPQGCENIVANLTYVFQPDLPEGRVDENQLKNADASLIYGHYLLIYKRDE